MSPKDELREIVEGVLPMLVESISEDGGFRPIAAVLRDNNPYDLLVAVDEPGIEAFESLKDAAKAVGAAINVRAILLFNDMRVTLRDGQKSDVICIFAEHRDATASVNLYRLYSVSGTKVTLADHYDVVEPRRNEFVASVAD